MLARASTFSVGALFLCLNNLGRGSEVRFRILIALNRKFFAVIFAEACFIQGALLFVFILKNSIH